MRQRVDAPGGVGILGDSEAVDLGSLPGRTLCPPDHGPGQVEQRPRLRPSRKNEGPQFGQGTPNSSHHSSNRSTLAWTIRRAPNGGLDHRVGQVRSNIEEFVLYLGQDASHPGRHVPIRQRQADHAVGLVGLPVGGDPWIGLPRLRHVRKPGFAPVAGAGVDACQLDHARSLCDKLVDVKKWVVGFVLFLLVSACAQGEPPNSNPDGTVNCSYRVSGQAAKPTDPPPQGRVPATGEVVVTMQMGGAPVTITLDRSKAPCTVNSFESLAKQGYFDGTACRLSTQGIFILQCGDRQEPGGAGRATCSTTSSGRRDYPAERWRWLIRPEHEWLPVLLRLPGHPAAPAVHGIWDHRSGVRTAHHGHRLPRPRRRYPDRTGFPNGRRR